MEEYQYPEDEKKISTNLKKLKILKAALNEERAAKEKLEEDIQKLALK